MSTGCDPFAAPEAGCPAEPRTLPLRIHGERLRNCGSVRQCFLTWHLLAAHLGQRAFLTHRPEPFLGVPSEEIRAGLEKLETVVAGRGKHFAEAMAWAYHNSGVVAHAMRKDVSDLDPYQPNGPLPLSRAALLVHFTAPSEHAAAEAQPFIDMLKCFANYQGMKFVFDTAPHLQYSWIHWRSGNLLKNAYVLQAGPVVDGPAMALNGSQPLAQLLGATDEELLRRLAPAGAWREAEERLGVVNGNPMRWAKAWSIAQTLKEYDFVIYADYDVTVRPDCMATAPLLKTLFKPTRRGTVPHIAIRDSPAGVDCFNSGFLALRRTPVVEAFLRMWQVKLGWPGVLHGDQGALAETILELLNLEDRISGSYSPEDLKESTGYNHQCIQHLFPLSTGLVSWRDYCECFQHYLTMTAGPYLKRTSRFIHFVDPRHLDVNFVANSLAPSHQESLKRMRLLPFRPGDGTTGFRAHSRNPLVQLPALSPLFIHWAGIDNRTRLMREYLVRRFGVRPGWFRHGLTQKDRCVALIQRSKSRFQECTVNGTMGSNIEHIWQSWDWTRKLDDIRKPEADAAAEVTFERCLAGAAEAPCGARELPTRKEDAFTASARFRADLLESVGGPEAARGMVVFEIGTYLGYTTRFLAGAFRAVVGVERNETYVQRARQLLASCSNATVLHLNTMIDDWAPAIAAVQASGGADVVLVDGDHAYEPVLADLSLALLAGLGPPHRGGRPRFVALDDHPTRAEVSQAADDFAAMGILRLGPQLGEGEGVLCEVVG